MSRLLTISYLNVKNAVRSKKFLLGIVAAFAYSMLWILIVHPPKYGLDGYDFEFGRLLYLIMLYEAVSVLRNDIKFNTTKAVFTGIYSRIEIMISKGISLILFGFVFYILVEINNILASIILYKKIGIAGFLAFNHLHLLIIYVAITFTMGSLMLLIASIMFNESKSILFFIVFLSMINFYTAGITTLVMRNPEIAPKLSVFMKTPFYNVVMLTQGEFSFQAVLINVLWAVIFFLSSTLIINIREIK